MKRNLMFAGLLAVASGCATMPRTPTPGGNATMPETPTPGGSAYGPNYGGWNIGSITASGKYSALPPTGIVYYAADAAAADRGAGTGATSGFSLGYDQVNFLDLNLPERLMIGINTSLEFAYVKVDWKGIYESASVETPIGDLVTDLTLGPVVSFNPTGSVFVEGALRFGVGVAGVRGMTIANYPLQGGNTADVTESGGVGVGFATAFGLRVRWERLIVGAEWTSFGGNQTRKYEITTCCTNSRDESFEYKNNVGTKFSRIYIGLTSKK